jgi:hypothetical protein
LDSGLFSDCGKLTYPVSPVLSYFSPHNHRVICLLAPYCDSPTRSLSKVYLVHRTKLFQPGGVGYTLVLVTWRVASYLFPKKVMQRPGCQSVLCLVYGETGNASRVRSAFFADQTRFPGAWIPAQCETACSYGILR